MSQGFTQDLVVAGVISVNGLMGIVVLTADEIPETLTRFYLDANQKDAANNANSPDATNPFAVLNDILAIIATLALKENKSEKGVALGYVPLNAATQIDPAYINFPGLNYQNSWDAFTNTPTLADGVGTAGDAYIVGVAGTQDLGSGNITFAVGDLVIYSSGNIWQKITGVALGVSSVNGFTGAVVLTADNIAETATRFYLTSDQNAGMDAAPVTGANRVATMSDLNIIVGQTYLMPENFADSQTLGDGTLRTLSSLGYTNGSAGAVWTRVNATYGMNVASQSIDWVAWQEMELFKRDTGATGVILTGGKGYCPSQSIDLAKDQLGGAFYKRSRRFTFDGNGSAFANRTGTNFPLLNRYPANQAEANGLILDYGYIFRDMAFYGRATTDPLDCGIRLGATSFSSFENITSTDCGITIDTQFCLEPTFSRINVGNYGLYGLRIGDGLWSGAGTNNSQSNNVYINQFRSYNGNGATPTAAIYCNGNRNIYGNIFTFEGFNGAVHHFLYDNLGATTTKNLVDLRNMDFEAAGASRAGIRIISNSGQMALTRFNNQVPSVDMPVLLEVESTASPLQIKVWDTSHNLHTGWTFRQVGVNSARWDVYDVRLNDNDDFTAAANWDTSLGGVIPTDTYYRFTPVQNNFIPITRVVYIGGDVINNNAIADTLQDVTGLSFPVIGGRRYHFKFVIPFQSAAGTTGSRWTVNGPSAGLLAYRSEYTLTSTTTTTNENVAGYDLPAAANASSNSGNNMAIIEGVLIANANGTMIARFASEVSGSAITAKGGAVCYYTETI